MKNIYGLVLMCLLSFSALAEQSVNSGPFEVIDYSSFPSVIVTVDGTEFYLLGIDGVHRKEIMSSCEITFADQCQKEFSENFTESMELMGYPVGSEVTLRLYLLSQHKIVEVTKSL